MEISTSTKKLSEVVEYIDARDEDEGTGSAGGYRKEDFWAVTDCLRSLGNPQKCPFQRY
jgi:hypothetical protein